jgi:hypothetical protein
MPSLDDKTSSPSPAPDTMNLPAKMPRIPDEVLERFPDMESYQSELDKWWGIVVGTVSDTNEESSTVINQNNTGLLNLTVTVDGVTASIVELAEIVSDGFGNLSGKYTLTVTAGDVVTGMNITSSTGPGTNISEVTFQADRFQIYSGTTKKVMFVADAINDVVRLADTLVVDAANAKVYIGVGNYGNADTAWYVDDTGRMSLKDKLTWDGTTLTIVGAVNATTGMIGGFDIGSDYIRDTGNSFGMASTVTGGDDIRFWAGDTFANRATAPLRISESGALVASSADISGTIVSDSGTIGGFTLAAGSLSAGSGASYIEISSSGSSGMKIGGTSSTPGYSGDSAVGFAVEAGTNSIFVSRADNFAASFNRNDDGGLVLFHRSATLVGSISVNTTTTTYNTTSDRRLKQLITDAPRIGDLIDLTPVREFEFMADPGKRYIGFIAQELFDTFPDAVTPGDSDNDVLNSWMVDYSKLVPILFLEIQDLRRRIAGLEV